MKQPGACACRRRTAFARRRRRTSGIAGERKLRAARAALEGRERELAEKQEALRRSQEMLHFALRASKSLAWHLDFNTGKVIFSDNAAELGVDPNATQEERMALIHPDDRAAVLDGLDKARRGIQPPSYTYRILRMALGEVRTMEARSLFLHDAAGRPTSAVGLTVDITEHARAEELRARTADLEAENRRAVEASRLKSEFLANMSHELRTPLNAIIGFAELLYDGQVEAGSLEHQEFLGDILTSGKHLLELINDVLDLAKIEAGKLEFFAEPVDVGAIVVEVRNILRALAANKRILVDIVVDPSLPQISIDPSRLKQVLYNYLSNALKFTPEGGRIAVRVEPEGSSSFRIEVQDNGIGIGAHDIGRLFVEFEQLDSGATKRHRGTGLGLALTRRLVEAQGGRVGVRSMIGEGSVFFAVLPRGAPVASHSAAPTPRAESGAPLVLVIEDDPADQQHIVHALTSAGYAVEAFASGASALTRCREQAFAAITLDVLLSDMSGLEVLAGLRALGTNRHAPVIVVTRVSELHALPSAGIRDILSKPVDPASLVASLARAGITPGMEPSRRLARGFEGAAKEVP